MNTGHVASKQLQQLLLKRVLNNQTIYDNRSEFDKVVDVQKFREKFFSNGSDWVKNNPGYRIRQEQLRTNEEALILIRNDLHQSLLNAIPEGQLELEDNNCNIHHFSNYNAISEDFIIETQMLIANRKDDRGKNVMALGYGFIYIADAISGRKLFLGKIKLRKDKADPVMHLTVCVNHAIFKEMTNHIANTSLISFFVDKNFTGIRNTLLKQTERYRLSIAGMAGTANGRKTMHIDLIADLKELSPNFIDIIQLANLRKILY